MENNKEFANEGYENFEDQGKYKRKISKKEKRADLFGEISVVLLIIAVISLGLDRALPTYVDIELEIGIFNNWTDVLFTVFYILFIIFAFIGFCIRRTKLTKAMFALGVALPIALIVGFLVGYVFLYMLISPLARMAWSSL